MTRTKGHAAPSPNGHPADGVPLPKNDPRLAQPLLTLREAAWNLAIPQSTFRTWTLGPLVTTIDAGRRRASVPFIGVAEGLVLAAFRRRRVPMQRIRPAIQRLNEEIGLDHALASGGLYTDGAEVLYDYATSTDDAEIAQLTVVRSGQRVFHEAVRDYLELITYGGDGWPTALRLPAYRSAVVVIDPTRAFGLPLFENGGARVEDVLDRWRAGESFAALADDFGVPSEEIEDAARTAAARAAA